MASEFGLTEVSKIFIQAFGSGKGIEPGSYEVWLRIFSEVSDGTLTKAAHWLVGKREIMRAVVPGELAKAIEAVGGTMGRYKPGKTFKDDPIVRALDSRSKHEADEGGMALHEWLWQEGYGSFREAAEANSEEAGGVVPVQTMSYGDFKPSGQVCRDFGSLYGTKPWRWNRAIRASTARVKDGMTITDYQPDQESLSWAEIVKAIEGSEDERCGAGDATKRTGYRQHNSY